jgi:hypothetical protein
LDIPDLIQPALTTIGINGEIILKNEENIVLPQNGRGTNINDEIVHPQKVGTTNCGVFKEGVSINTVSNNTYSLNQSIYQEACPEEEIFLETDPIDEIDYEKIVAENIDLKNLNTIYPEEMVEGILDLIVDTLYSQQESLIVSKEKIPIERIKKRLLKLRYKHICYVIDSIENTDKRIEKIDSYILTCLFNASKTIDSHYANQANVIANNIRNGN